MRGTGDFHLARVLSMKLEESFRLIVRIQDRVERRDLEAEARYAGTLLAAHIAAARALCEARDVAAAASAASAYVDRLDSAITAVEAVHEKALARAPLGAVEGEGGAPAGEGGTA